MILLYHTIGKISIEFQNKISRYFADSGNFKNFPASCGNSPDRYFESIGNSKFEIRNSKLIENVEASASILMQGLVDFEFRTTLTRELHLAEDMEAIGRWIGGAEKYFLQTYRDEGDLIEGGFTAYNREETEELLGIVKKYLPNAEIRG